MHGLDDEKKSIMKVSYILFSDLNVFESFEDGYLADVRKKADDLGVEVQAGTGGICPSAKRFNDKWGTAEELLALTIRVAQAMGSNAARCYLGGADDRKGEGGIGRKIEETVGVLKKVRSRALDAGVKVGNRLPFPLVVLKGTNSTPPA